MVELGRRRHNHPDTTLADYRSRLNTLVSAGWMTDPLAPPKLILASELAAGVHWRREGGLQVQMLGQRYVTSFGRDVEAGLDFGQPWFVSTTPGDSLRVLGSIEIPNRAAIHPFADGAGRFYEYELGDTVALLVPGKRIDLVEVRVTPTTGDESLVVGSLWVDMETGDIGAMQIRFVGRPLWADDDEPDDQKWANRILSVSASIQQGYWETRYWLPHRQELELMVRIPFIGNFAIPVLFRSEFGRYDINTGEPIAWLSPDSLRQGDENQDYDHAMTITLGPDDEPQQVAGADTAGAEDVFPETELLEIRAGSAEGGWEIVRPPDDSLLAYDEWDRPLEEPASELTLPSAEELERRAQELSNDIVGRQLFSIQYDRLLEMIRYNRIEALGIGVFARYDLPRKPFWSLGGGIAFGVADLEFKGRLDLRYDAPSKRAQLAGYSELHLAGVALTDDKRAYGPSALRAFILGRDDADYYRSSGAALTLGRRWGRFSARLGAGWENQKSVTTNTQVAIPGIWQSVVFPANPPANEGDYWRGDLAFTFYLGDWTRPTDRAELTLGVEVGTGPDSLEYVQPRALFETRVDLGTWAAIAFNTKGGWTAAGYAPNQRLWGIGSLQTVRGFTYGTQRGDSYWSAQLEVSPKRKVITPVAFGDIGWAGGIDDWPGSEPLWSFGVGASWLWGVLRTDLVFPKAEELWFELYFAGSL